MPLHARSDLAYVFVSEAHGGCNSAHRRPVEHGAPVKLWTLDCPRCENHLRHHSDQWSPTLAEIPETHDEKIAREDADKRGLRDRDQFQLMILARLAGMEVPEALMTSMSPALQSSVAGIVLCPSEHENAPGSKFCAQCGASLNGTAKRALEAPEPAAAPAAPVSTEGLPPTAELEEMHIRTLVGLCNKRGLDYKGSKADLIGRLLEHAAAAA